MVHIGTEKSLIALPSPLREPIILIHFHSGLVFTLHGLLLHNLQGLVYALEGVGSRDHRPARWVLLLRQGLPLLRPDVSLIVSAMCRLARQVLVQHIGWHFYRCL